jgi:hypothetical protein
MIASAMGPEGANWTLNEHLEATNLDTFGSGVIIGYGKHAKAKAMLLQKAFKAAQIATRLTGINNTGEDVINVFVSDK